MSKAGRNFRILLASFYLAAVHVALVYFAVNYFFPELRSPRTSRITVADPTSSTPPPTPLPIPSEFVEPHVPPVNAVSEPSSEVLAIPVKGVRRSDLIDTFASARGEGRTHGAIDIPAPLGTPVLAAADGEVLKFFDSADGGITIYQSSADKRYVFYYAHLQRRADGLNEHDMVKRGSIIAYVGDTGNAGSGNFHLHFAIAVMSDPKRFWGGPYVNPFPLLTSGIETP